LRKVEKLYKRRRSSKRDSRKSRRGKGINEISGTRQREEARERETEKETQKKADRRALFDGEWQKCGAATEMREAVATWRGGKLDRI